MSGDGSSGPYATDGSHGGYSSYDWRGAVSGHASFGPYATDGSDGGYSSVRAQAPPTAQARP